MQAITPYLNFNGNGAEALKFYAVALEGKIVHSQTFGESGMAVAEEGENRIMHALFEADKLQFMISDCQPGKEVSSGDQVHLSLNFDSLDLINTCYPIIIFPHFFIMPYSLDTFKSFKFYFIQNIFS